MALRFSFQALNQLTCPFQSPNSTKLHLQNRPSAESTRTKPNYNSSYKALKFNPIPSLYRPSRIYEPSSIVSFRSNPFLESVLPYSQSILSNLISHFPSSDSQSEASLSPPHYRAISVALGLILIFSNANPALARPTGVNRPELLPEIFTRVIDVAGFLSPGQEERLSKDLERLENDTGFKLRVLAQNYPETPGLAIKDFWKVDDETIVFVADPSMGNILNFNVGASVDLAVPRSFWSRLAGKYGNIFYWRENGEDSSIESAVIAIDNCLREPIGPRQCAEIK